MSPIILVVDDEPGMREILQVDLELDGYSVLTAESGNKALVIIDQNKVDLIISDVRMPDGDGIYLLKEVRRRNPEIPVVAMITGFSDYSEDDVRALGAQVMLVKPYKFENLSRQIKLLLRLA